MDHLELGLGSMIGVCTLAQPRSARPSGLVGSKWSEFDAASNADALPYGHRIDIVGTLCPAGIASTLSARSALRGIASTLSAHSPSLASLVWSR